MSFLLEFEAGIRCEGRRSFEDQRTDMHKELCSLPIN